MLELHSVSFRNNSKLSKGKHVSVRRPVAAVSIRALTLVVGWISILHSKSFLQHFLYVLCYLFLWFWLERRNGVFSLSPLETAQHISSAGVR